MTTVDTVKQQILDKADLVDVVSKYVRLQKRGGRHFGLCPFHSEKTPSFSVNGERGFFHCFGCGRGGNVIDFVMGVENLTFHEARTYLANQMAIPIEDTKRNIKHREIDRYQVMDLAASLYEKWLSDNGKAIEYVRSRGLTAEHVKQFSLGFAPDAWDSLLNRLNQHKIPLDVQSELGLIVPRNTGNGHYDRFRNRIMFPIRNTLGRVIAFGGRAMDPKDPAKYLNSNETPLFNKSKVLYLLDRAKDVLKVRGAVLVEGYMDAISLHASGFTQAVATLGTALTPDHVQILRRYTQKYTLLYDGDNAGINAARRGVEVFFELGASPLVVLLPMGMDPDDYIKSEGKEAIQHLLENSMSGFDFYLQQAMKKHDSSTPNGKIALVEEMVPLLSRVPDQLILNDYVERMAMLTGSQVDALHEALRKRIHKSQSAQPAKANLSKSANKQAVPQVEIAKETLIRLLAFHLGCILPDGMHPSEKPNLFAQTDLETEMPALLERLNNQTACDSLLAILIKEAPYSSGKSHSGAAWLEEMFSDPAMRTQFIALLEKEPLPNSEKMLRKLRDEVMMDIRKNAQQQSYEELKRKGDLQAINELLYSKK